LYTFSSRLIDDPLVTGVVQLRSVNKIPHRHLDRRFNQTTTDKVMAVFLSLRMFSFDHITTFGLKSDVIKFEFSAPVFP